MSGDVLKTTNDNIVKRVQRNPKFDELVYKKSMFGWALSAIMLVIYYGFILLLAFAPQALKAPIYGTSVTTLGIPVGISIILSAFVLTGIYVRRANTEFDRINQEIIEEARG